MPALVHRGADARTHLRVDARPSTASGRRCTGRSWTPAGRDGRRAAACSGLRAGAPRPGRARSGYWTHPAPAWREAMTAGGPRWPAGHARSARGGRAGRSPGCRSARPRATLASQRRRAEGQASSRRGRDRHAASVMRDGTLDDLRLEILADAVIADVADRRGAEVTRSGRVDGRRRPRGPAAARRRRPAAGRHHRAWSRRWREPLLALPTGLHLRPWRRRRRRRVWCSRCRTRWSGTTPGRCSTTRSDGRLARFQRWSVDLVARGRRRPGRSPTPAGQVLGRAAVRADRRQARHRLGRVLAHPGARPRPGRGVRGRPLRPPRRWCSTHLGAGGGSSSTTRVENARSCGGCPAGRLRRSRASCARRCAIPADGRWSDEHLHARLVCDAPVEPQ